jgi:hypothetical protein
MKPLFHVSVQRPFEIFRSVLAVMLIKWPLEIKIQTLNSFSQNPTISNFSMIIPAFPELFNTYRRTDGRRGELEKFNRCSAGLPTHLKKIKWLILKLLFMLVRHTITITKLKPPSVNFFVYYIIPSFTCFGPWAIIRRTI